MPTQLETDQMPTPRRPRRGVSKLDLVAKANLRTFRNTDDPDTAVHSAKHAGTLLDRQDEQGRVLRLSTQPRTYLDEKPEPEAPDQA